jgi:ELWxxDGT repeat protein
MNKNLAFSLCSALALMASGLSAQNPSPPSLLLDINPGSANSYPRDFVALESKLLFTADDGAHGRELWITDGTAAGTQMLVDLQPGATGSDPQELVRFGLHVAFVADDGQSGRELWITDGTAAGTKLLADLVPGANGSDPEQLICAQSRLFFVVDEGSSGKELWTLFSAGASPQLVLDIRPGSAGSEPKWLHTWNDLVAFSADDGQFGRELWLSDGTAAGTYMVLDMNSGPGDSNPVQMIDFGDTLVYRAQYPGAGNELVSTDGTAAGTVLIHDSLPGNTSGTPNFLREHRGKIYYTANLNQYAYSWDGQTVTQLINANLIPYNPDRSFFPVGDEVAFSAGPNRDLWITDGTVQGTRLVIPTSSTSLRPLRPDAVVRYGYDQLLISARDPGLGRDLWITDGTDAGTMPLEIVPRAGNSSPLAEEDARLPGTVVVVAYDPTNGYEPRIFKDGALAVPHGDAYSPGGAAPTFWSEDPAIGSVVPLGGTMTRGLAAVLVPGSQARLFSPTQPPCGEQPRGGGVYGRLGGGPRVWRAAAVGRRGRLRSREHPDRVTQPGNGVL